MIGIFTEVIYWSLTSMVPSTLGIMVPLAGAFWIFKVREKSAAEGKLFELGREIANLIQSKEIRGPIEGVSYSYIDKAQYKIGEKNREKAMKILLNKYLHLQSFRKNSTEEEEIEAANIVVAIATERVQALTPSTVNWSGKGSFYSPSGEDIKTRDSHFPFGTKLYRHWIGKFGDIYNDLWAITTSRRFFVANFSKQYENTPIGIDEMFVGKWLDEIDERIKKIHPIHAKLLTQLQIIDTQVDLPRFRRDIAFLAFYASLLSLVGYFVPRLAYLADPSSLGIFIWLSLATFLAYSLIAIRVIAAVQPVKEKDVQRELFMPKLTRELKDMEKRCMRYRPHVINDILSMNSDLKLSKTLHRTLLSLVDKIQKFNDCASIFYSEAETLIEPTRNDFKTIHITQKGFGIDLLDLIDTDFNLGETRSIIMKENYSFFISHKEMHSTHEIFTVNLPELSRERRLDLYVRLDSLRMSLLGLSSCRSSISALRELQECRSNAQGLLEKSYSRMRVKDWLAHISS